MKRIFLITLTMLLCSYLSYSQPTVTVGTVEANTGDVVVVPVTMDGFTGVDFAVNGITMFIEYDGTKLSNPSFQNVNTSLFPGSIYEAGNPNIMAYIWSTGTEAIDVPDGTLIFNLQFTYIGTTATELTWDTERSLFTNDALDELDVTYIDGAVTPPGEPPAGPTVTVGTVEANTGDIVIIPVTMDGFSGVDFAVNGITMFIDYDGTKLSNPSFQNVNTSLFPGSIYEAGNPNVMAYIWSTGTEAVDVPDGTLIFNLQFTYIGTTATDLTWDTERSLFTNDALDELDVNYINGGVSPAGGPPSLQAPVLASPINGATDQETTLNLAWESVLGADSYNIELSTDQTFGFAVSYQTDETSFEVTGLEEETTYYWRVNAFNNEEESDWSEVWSFSTQGFVFDGPTVKVGTVEANTGDVVLVPVTMYGFSGVDYAVNGITMFVDYDGTKLSNPSFQDVNTSLFPGSIYEAGNPNVMAYIWSTGTEAIDVPDGTLIFNLQFTYIGTSETDLTWDTERSLFTNDALDELDVTYINGSVTPAGGPPPLQAPVLVSPVNGATGVSINPLLTWNAVSGATGYDIELSEDQAFTQTIAYQTDGTSVEVEGLNYNTTYYWRASAFNDEEESDWSGVWSFITEEEEVPEPPAAPLLVAPENEAVDLPISSIILEWEAVEEAAYYTVEILETSDFIDPYTFETSLTSINLTGFEYLTTYYWRVSATNENGTSEWSEVWWFITEPFVPAAPVLIAPLDASEDLPLAVDFSWYESEDADSYYIEVATDISFSGIVLGEEVFETGYQGEFEYETTYFWHVKAIAEGYESEWSQVWAFTTKSEYIPAPVLVSPLNNTSDVSIEGIDLTWEITFPAIESYFEVSANDIFSDILASGWTEETTVFFGDLAYGTQYFWRVKAKSDLSNESDWSAAWSFTTESAPVPEAPVLLAPLNNEVDVPTVEVNFTWEEVETAIEYYIEVATSPVFSNNIVYYGTVYNNEATFYNLTGLSTFYWRVNATNELGGISEWSEVWSFQTAEADPFIWTANTGNNATVLIPYTSTPTINRVPLEDGDWVAAFSPLGFCVGAVEWVVQPPPQEANHLTVWGDDDQTAETDGMIVGQTIGYKLYKASTGEYYTANSVAYSQGSGNYAVNGYYVISTLAYLDEDWIDAPILVSPFDGSLNLSPSLVEFNWEAADNANMYNFELSTDSDFDFAIARQTSQTTIDIEGLEYGTTYYWRVNGYNDNFTSEWSEVWSFTTEQEVFCDPPTVQGKNIIFSSVTSQSMKVRWTRGNGEKVLVVAYPGEIDATPELYTSYAANSVYGEGSMIGSGYAIYNGTGDRVDVTGLLGGVLYTFKVYEYNYSECIAYNVNNAANNPRSKSTLPAAPVIIPTTYKSDTGFLAEWTYSGNVDAFEIYLYNSEGNLIEDYDVGNVNSIFIDELTPTTLYYYAVIANYGGSYTFSTAEPVITLDVEPTNGPTGLTAEVGIVENTIDLSWLKPSDAYRTLIVAYDYEPGELIAMPEDATEYEFDTNFGNAPELNNGKVVYIGTSQNTTISGLEPFTQYFFNVFVFNGGVVTQYDTYPLNTHNYNTEDYGSINIWNIALPTPVMLTPDNKWEEGFSTYWEYDVDEDPDAFELWVNGDVFDLPGEFRDFDLDDLSANTLYSVKIRAYYALNDSYSAWSNIEEIKTLANEPDQPTNLVFTEIADVSLRVTWTKAQNAEKTIVVAYNIGSYNSGVPEDNHGYPAGNTSFGDGTALGDGYIVYNGTGNTFVLSNLMESGFYYFELYAYNGSGVQGDDILNSFNYNSDPLTGDVQTAVSAPTEAPSNVHFPTIGTTQLNVAWTPGDGANSIVFAKTDSYPFTAPFNGESYSANAVYGLGDEISGAYVVYAGSGDNVTVTGLAEGTTYYFAVYTFNGFGAGTVYLSTAALGNETTKLSAPVPLGQDRVITFRNSTATSVALTWLLPTSGAGSYRVALAKAGSALTVNDFPVNGVTYDPSTVFGAGSQVGDAYVVYNAAAVPSITTPLTVTGLATGTTYHFRVFAYNITEDGPGTESYNLNSAVFNPREKVAGSREALAGDEYDGYEGNAQFSLSSIAPNPVSDLINFSMNVYESSPVTIEIYNADGNRIVSIQESKTMSLGEHSFSIPTGNVAAGLYILKVSTGASEFAIQSFIVMP